MHNFLLNGTGNLRHLTQSFPYRILRNAIDPLVHHLVVMKLYWVAAFLPKLVVGNLVFVLDHFAQCAGYTATLTVRFFKIFFSLVFLAVCFFLIAHKFALVVRIRAIDKPSEDIWVLCNMHITLIHCFFNKIQVQWPSQIGNLQE